MTPQERDRVEALAKALDVMRDLVTHLPEDAPLERRARVVVREVFAELAVQLKLPPGYFDPRVLVARAAEVVAEFDATWRAPLVCLSDGWACPGCYGAEVPGA